LRGQQQTALFFFSPAVIFFLKLGSADKGSNINFLILHQEFVHLPPDQPQRKMDESNVKTRQSRQGSPPERARLGGF
jgi:hypothetical protein